MSPALLIKLKPTSPWRIGPDSGDRDRVDRIFQLGQAGLKFTHAPLPPRALPSRPGLIYFQVDRDSQLEEWQHVCLQERAHSPAGGDQQDDSGPLPVRIEHGAFLSWLVGP